MWILAQLSRNFQFENCGVCLLSLTTYLAITLYLSVITDWKCAYGSVRAEVFVIHIPIFYNEEPQSQEPN